VKNKKPVLVKQGLYLERTVGTRTFFNPLLYQLSYRAETASVAQTDAKSSVWHLLKNTIPFSPAKNLVCMLRGANPVFLAQNRAEPWCHVV
jgi:hypothetical protein